MRAHVLLAASLPIFLLAACGDDDDDGNGEPGPLRAVTYNLGLARGFVDYADERAPLAIEALADQELSLACVQEVWYPEHVQALQDATQDKWPHQIFLEPDPGEDTGTGPACGDTDLDPLEACVEAACAGVPTDQLAGCVLANCATEFGALTSECQTCLSANIGADLETIRVICTSPGGGAYAYGGSFGIGVLTDRPVLAQDHLLFESTYNRRAVIHARVDDPDFGEVDVFCTHLSAIFASVPYPGEGSWAAEQAAQIDAMIQWVAERSGEGNPQLLLGDFNTGPELPGMAAEHPENYAKFIDAGFTSAYADAASPQCSFCESNPLVGEGSADDDASVLIDHVFLKGLEPANPRRLFTENVDYTFEGEAVSTPPSDHYGVAVDFAAGG